MSFDTMPSLAFILAFMAYSLLLGLVMPDDHNYDTMSAFIVDLLGRIPEQDEAPSVIYDNIEFTVLLTEDNWISKIKAKKLEITNDETEA